MLFLLNLLVQEMGQPELVVASNIFQGGVYKTANEIVNL
jgi:hypothetical protein